MTENDRDDRDRNRATDKNGGEIMYIWGNKFKMSMSVMKLNAFLELLSQKYYITKMWIEILRTSLSWNNQGNAK